MTCSTFHTRATGRAIMVFLCLILLFTGCGLGDATIPLINGYELIKDETCIIHKKDTINSMISDLDITAYCIREEYILLEGVLLAGDQRISNTNGYYVINSLTDEVYGMLDTSLQLQYQCEELGISADFEWTEV